MTLGKILITDDDAETRQLLSHLLHKNGYEVVSVGSGQEAQDEAVKVRPALIVMDIGMAEMDGMTTIWQLRENRELADVPIIVLTAFDSYDLRAEAASAGCQAYVTKPFEVSDFVAVVGRVLKSD